MANPWVKLRELIVGDPLLVGTVESINDDDTTTLTVLGGGRVKVRTAGQQLTVGSQAFFKGDELVGEAPDLPQVEIEV